MLATGFKTPTRRAYWNTPPHPIFSNFAFTVSNPDKCPGLTELDDGSSTELEPVVVPLGLTHLKNPFFSWISLDFLGSDCSHLGSVSKLPKNLSAEKYAALEITCEGQGFYYSAIANKELNHRNVHNQL